MHETKGKELVRTEAKKVEKKVLGVRTSVKATLKFEILALTLETVLGEHLFLGCYSR